MNATFKTIMLWLSLLVVIFLAWHFAQIQKPMRSRKGADEINMLAQAGFWSWVTLTDTFLAMSRS